MSFDLRLERALKSSRDPKDWLILADFYADWADVMETREEKQSQEDLAEHWRLVSRLASGLLPLWAELVATGKNLPKEVGYTFRKLNLPECEVSLKRTQKMVFIVVFVLRPTQPATTILHTRTWRWECQWSVYWPADAIKKNNWKLLVWKLHEMARFIRG